jgi:glycosyltransferase involved in cell wall biosynthesis
VSVTKLSVIIPNYNSGDLLERCLAALRASETAEERLHEIIVVDDASTDSSTDAVDAYGATLCRSESNLGPAHARNLGAEKATGDVLWFLDADVEVRPDALATVMRFVDEHPDFAAAIGSYDDNPAEPNACSQFKNLFHHYVHQTGGPWVSSFWSGCGLVRADVFREVGGFDAQYWKQPSVEDIHLGYVLGRRGYRIHMLKDLQVKHWKRWALVSLVRTDVFQRAVPWTSMLLRNKGQGGSELNLGWKARASVVSVYLAILAAIASLFLPWAWILAGASIVLPLALHSHLLAFFRRRGGAVFLFFAIPLLLLYFFYCGVGFVLGVGQYLWESWTGRHAFTEAGDGAATDTSRVNR